MILFGLSQIMSQAVKNTEVLTEETSATIEAQNVEQLHETTELTDASPKKSKQSSVSWTSI